MIEMDQLADLTRVSRIDWMEWLGGAPIMLLKNLDQIEHLYNGPRLVVTRLTNHVIGAKIIFGNKIDHEVCIP